MIRKETRFNASFYPQDLEMSKTIEALKYRP